jgi:Xaa-Pro dipeptidase
VDKFETDLTTLHPILTECRVSKSELELALIQYANDISSEAHVEVTLSKISYLLNMVI